MVCIDFTSACEASSRLSAPIPTSAPSRRALKNVTAGSKRPSIPKACTWPGGVTARENARCSCSRARTSSTRGSSTAMTRAMLRSLPRGRAPRRHRVAYARSTVDEHRSIGTCSPARTDMQPDEPIEHELLRNAVAAEVTVTSTEVSPTSTGDRYVRIEGRLGDDEESHVERDFIYAAWQST